MLSSTAIPKLSGPAFVPSPKTMKISCPALSTRGPQPCHRAENSPHEIGPASSLQTRPTAVHGCCRIRQFGNAWRKLSARPTSLQVTGVLSHPPGAGPVLGRPANREDFNASARFSTFASPRAAEVKTAVRKLSPRPGSLQVRGSSSWAPVTGGERPPRRERRCREAADPPPVGVSSVAPRVVSGETGRSLRRVLRVADPVGGPEPGSRFGGCAGCLRSTRV